MRLPFNYCEPAFFAGLMDDPLLLVQVRPLGRSLLFDCGQIHHLAKRVLRSIDAVLITHAHMDHFMGVDALVRHVLVSPRTIDLYGPPGIATRFEHKLGSYDWNLAEDYWCSFRVHEVFPERLRSYLFAGAEGFTRRLTGERAREDGVVYSNRYLKVIAAFANHKIPVLFYRITERPGFAVDEARLRAAGLVAGSWIRELKKRFFSGELEGCSLRVLQDGPSGPQETNVSDGAGLYESIRVLEKPASIGYFSDLGFASDNRNALRNWLQGVTLLVGECTYLAQDRDRARASSHLCSSDVTALLADLRPEFFLPMHLSKSYLGQSAQLFREIQPPAGTTLLRLPERLTPRPLLPGELPPAARGRY